MLTDFDYYNDRATKAQASADRATSPQVRSIHLQLAERYRRMAGERSPADADDLQLAIDRIAEALSILDERGQTAAAALLSAALEMLVADQAS